MKGPASRGLSPWLAGFAAILPVAALAASPQSGPAAQARTFAPPTSPMVLTRTVRRPLSGGKELLVRRCYKVRFVPDGEGFRVEGQFAGSTVEVPESLRALAEIERKRPDTGMFPIVLDASGAIRSASPAGPSESLDRATSLISGRLDALPLAPMELEQARAFVRQVQAHAAGSQWPADLFHPATGRRVETRTIALPDGSHGSVTIEIAVQAPLPGGLLTSLERVVTTELDGDRRVTREQWTLSSDD